MAIDRGVRSNGFAQHDTSPIPGSPKRAVRLGSLKAGTPEAARFVRDYAKLTRDGTKAADLERILRVCHFSMIDIGTLSAVFAMVGPDEADRGHGGDFFHHYFTEELIRNCPLPHGSDPLAQASEYTYEYSINRTTPETEEQGSAEWQVVHHGADRQTFLVAKQIAESAIRDNPTPADVQRLSRPYAYQTMRFTRDVINASGHEMDDFVRHAPALLDTPNPDGVANVSFLLGRLEGEHAQQRARRMLENSRDRFLDQLSALDVPDADEATIGGHCSVFARFS